jgi:YihY family inner membrane protein
MGWPNHPRLAGFRRRSRLVDVVLETLDGYSRHRTGRNASLLAYMGMLTVFPLLLAATTVLGLVLKGNPDLQAKIIDSALSKIPIVGDAIAQKQPSGDVVATKQSSLPASWWALAVGLAGAVWGSLRAFVAMQTALDDIWEIHTGRDNYLRQRVRAIVGIGIVSVGQLGSVVLAAVVSEAGLPRTGQFLLTFGGLALNVAVVALMYRYLTSRDTTWRLVWRGAAFTGVLFTGLQILGTNIMSRQVADAGKVYGAFAGLIALAAWISFHGLIALVGAELNASFERIGNRVGPVAPASAAAAIKNNAIVEPHG